MANEVNLGTGRGLVPFRFGSFKKEEPMVKCAGSHYIYVAEVVYIAKDGKLHVVNVCRACGQVSFHEKQIASPGTPAILLKEKEKENVV
jgi:hypothetical protein